MVWDSKDLASNWGESSSWKTPKHAYPAVNFNWNDVGNKRIQFTDSTVFYDGGGNRTWNWQFGDNTNSSQQSPLHTYPNTGNYNVTLTATDKDDFSCSASKTVDVKKLLPSWKEIIPKF